MAKKQYMLIVAGILLISVLIFGYYFYPRKVEFKLVEKINLAKADHPLIIVSERKVLDKFLIEIFGTEALTDYSSLDFNKFDYMVSFNRKILNLRYSPYLSKKNDLCPYLKEKPVIPEYSNDIDDSIYIYVINRKNRYRGICP
jgi:hypothetical protein